MTYELFEEIVTAQALHQLCSRNCFPFQFDEIAKDEFQQIINRELGGKHPFSKEEMVQGYGKYIEAAEGVRHLFESGKIQASWASALRHLPNVGMFRVGYWDFADATSTRIKKPSDVDVYPHDHGRIHLESKCRQVHAMVGDRVCDAAIGSLRDAGSTITQLDLRYVTHGGFQWVDDGLLHSLDLSNLHALLFRPHCEDIGESWDWPAERKEYVQERCDVALSSMLSKCSGSLKRLKTKTSPMGWPTHPVVAMPLLEDLDVDFDINLSAFAEFIRNAKNLTSLKLRGVHGDNGGWRELWDAIRYHPSRMQLEFDQIYCNDAAEITLRHHTGDKCEDTTIGDSWDDIQESLGMYLSNSGKWNKCLHLWFEKEWHESDAESNFSE